MLVCEGRVWDECGEQSQSQSQYFDLTWPVEAYAGSVNFDVDAPASAKILLALILLRHARVRPKAGTAGPIAFLYYPRHKVLASEIQ